MELISCHVIVVSNGVDSADIEGDILCHGGVPRPRVALNREALVNLKHAFLIVLLVHWATQGIFDLNLQRASFWVNVVSPVVVVTLE